MASGDVKGAGLAEPIVALAADGAEIRRSIESLLSVPSGKMEEVLDTLGRFDVPATLSEERQRFLMRILETRLELLGKILDEHGA